MPVFILFPPSPAVPVPEILIITPLSPYANESFFPVNGDIVLGFHTTPLTFPLKVSLPSINITVDGASAVTNGVGQDGYNTVLHLGIFDGHLGYIWIVDPQLNLDASDTIPITAFAQTTNLIANGNITYAFSTGTASTFKAHFQWGAFVEGRYRLLTTPITDSQQVGDYLVFQASQFNTYADFLTAASLGILVSADNLSALKNFSDAGLADHIANNEVRLDQALGNPSPIPTLLGPTFATTASSPLSKQIGAIKLQPDGYA